MIPLLVIPAQAGISGSDDRLMNRWLKTHLTAFESIIVPRSS